MPERLKYFSEKLNTCLDETGAPPQIRERANILSKMLNIPRQQAWSLIAGQQFPDPDLLKQIAMEFEVDVKWLSGEK